MPLRNKMGRLRHMTLSFSSILINLLFPLPTGSLSSAGQHNDCCEIKIVVLSRSPPSSCQAARLESVNYFYNNTHPQAREEPPVDITISKINYQTKLTDQTWPHPILLLFLFFLFSLSLPRLSRWLIITLPNQQPSSVDLQLTGARRICKGGDPLSQRRGPLSHRRTLLRVVGG